MHCLPIRITILWSTKNTKKCIIISDTLFFKPSFYHINYSEYLVLTHIPGMIISEGKKHSISNMVFLEHKVAVICPYANYCYNCYCNYKMPPHLGQVTNGGEAARVRHRH
jgi:hypothetical protein